MLWLSSFRQEEEGGGAEEEGGDREERARGPGCNSFAESVVWIRDTGEMQFRGFGFGVRCGLR